MRAGGAAIDQALRYLAFSWGFCAFFPLGLAYLHFLLLLALLLVRGRWFSRQWWTGQRMLVLPMLAFLAWAAVAALVGGWHADTGTRLFHTARVVLLLLVGMALTPREARQAMLGFLCAAVLAALIVAAHHVWGLPPWDIWSSLLASRNNKSSANMIMMAVAAGGFFYLGLRNDPAWIGRKWSWPIALGLATVVAAHGVSRNAQLLLPVLAMVAIVCHLRRWLAVPAAAALALLLSVGAYQLSPATQQRFDTAFDQVRQVVSAADYTTGIGERWRMAAFAWEGMLARPVFGTGLGSWLPLWRPVAAETGKGLDAESLERHVEINNPHNDFLLAGMETGVPGLVFTAWLLLAFAWRGWHDRSEHGDATVLLAIGLIAIAMFNAPLRDAALGMTLLWLMGATVAGHRVNNRA